MFVKAVLKKLSSYFFSFSLRASSLCKYNASFKSSEPLKILFCSRFEEDFKTLVSKQINCSCSFWFKTSSLLSKICLITNSEIPYFWESTIFFSIGVKSGRILLNTSRLSPTNFWIFCKVFLAVFSSSLFSLLLVILFTVSYLDEPPF